MPADADANVLRALVRKLAREQDAPVFEPHVTLYAGSIAAARALEAMQEVAAPARFTLEVAGVEHSDEFTKTLFVQLLPSAEVQRLSDDLRAHVNGARDYELNPHLSLIYKELPAETRARLAAQTQIERRGVVFDRLRVISGPDETRNREDVGAWRNLGERRLREPSDAP